MLPAQNRLKRDQDFKKTNAAGRYSYSSLLTVKYYPNKIGVSRFGFVISTKADKRSTYRNKLKRRLREIIRLELAKILSGFDVVIIAKKAAVATEYGDLEKDLLGLLRKANLYAKRD